MADYQIRILPAAWSSRCHIELNLLEGYDGKITKRIADVAALVPASRLREPRGPTRPGRIHRRSPAVGSGAAANRRPARAATERGEQGSEHGPREMDAPAGRRGSGTARANGGCC